MLKNLTNKNSTTEKSSTKSKILVLGIILIIVLIGILSPMRKVNAEGTCSMPGPNGTLVNGTWVPDPTDPTKKICQVPTTTQPNNGNKTSLDASGTCTVISIVDGKKTEKTSETTENNCRAAAGTWTPNTKSPLEKSIKSCGVIGSSSLEGCVIWITYVAFYTIPSFFLTVAAQFLDLLLSITLSSALYTKTDFIPKAWAVVRDLSNIFFILILLYIAIKVILGLGGAEVKKMIAKVIIVALLINFSMFFTQVIIDTSNILALIFYNKINVNQAIGTGKTATEIDYIPVSDPTKTGIQEKDFAGGLAKAFKPGEMLSEDFFKKAKENTTTVKVGPAIAAVGTGAIAGSYVPVVGTAMGALIVGTVYASHVFLASPEVPTPLMLGIIIVSGLVMAFAAYAFFIAGFCFLSRLIELWILIIFSPFAFMSSTVPSILGSVEYLGWEAWSKRLLKIAFMAPIFMFFLYLIFLLIKADIFSSLAKRSLSEQTTMEAIVLLVIPAILVLILLLQATKFAKKASGELGEAVFKGAKIAGGLALGATAGLGAVALRRTAGRAGSAMANSRWAKNWQASGFGGEAVMSGLKKMQSGSFDVRGIKIAGKDLAGATGMKVGEAQKGGFKERREADVKKRLERAKEIEVGEDEPLKQALNKTEMDLQVLLSKNAQEIDTLDKAIERAEKEAMDAERNFKAGIISKTDFQLKAGAVANARQNKKDFREGREYMTTDKTGKDIIQKGTIETDGYDIANLERQQKTQAQEIKTTNVERKVAYAKKLRSKGNRALNFIASGGEYALHRGANEAAHKIITDVKLDSGTKT